MAQFATDFSEYETNAAPSDWTQWWNTSAFTPSVQASLLPSGTLSSKALRITGTSISRYALTWDAVGNVTGNVEILCRWLWAHTSNVDDPMRAHICTGGSAGAENGYFLNTWFNQSPTVVGSGKYVSGTATVLDTPTFSLARSTWYWVRLQKSSTTIRFKIWAHGSAEPGSWTSSITDSSLSSGRVGIGRANNGGTLWCDFFSVGTGGDSAPAELLPIDAGVLADVLELSDTVGTPDPTISDLSDTVDLTDPAPAIEVAAADQSDAVDLTDSEPAIEATAGDQADVLDFVDEIAEVNRDRELADGLDLSDVDPWIEIFPLTEIDQVDLADDLLIEQIQQDQTDTISVADLDPGIEAMAEVADSMGLADEVGDLDTYREPADYVDLVDPTPAIGVSAQEQVDVLRLLDTVDREIAVDPFAPLHYLKVFDQTESFVGLVPAEVSWTQRLNGTYALERIVIEREHLLSDGTRASRLSMIDDGWYVEWDGYRYVLEDTDTDLETTVQARAIDAATDLCNFFVGYTPGATLYLNRTPTDIATSVLSGKRALAFRNQGFGILDASDKPTNWTPGNAANWSSALVSNRRVYQAAAGTNESVSDEHRCTPGVTYQFKVQCKAPVAMSGSAGIKVRWILRDGSTVDSTAFASAETGDFVTVQTDELVAPGEKYRLVLYTASSGSAVQFDDVQAYEIGPDTNYTYIGSMDARDALIPFGDGAIQKYGLWSEGGGDPATYLQASVAGEYIGRVFNGSFVTIKFAAGGSGRTCKIRINGVQYQASGTTLVRGTNAVSVASAVNLTLSGLDPANDHIVEVEVVTGPVRVMGFEVSTANLISMRYENATNVYEAIAGIQKAVGGEMRFDTVAKTITHVPQLGQDLRASNVLEFRRGVNITHFQPNKDRKKIVNRLTGLGYGEGENQLMVSVDATGMRDGRTSIEKYGIRRGTYTDKDCKSVATMVETLRRLVEISCWTTDSYTVRCLDSAAALCAPGDMGHFIYKDENLQLRILEITRDNVGGAAVLRVAALDDDVADEIVAIKRELSTLQRGFQGVPTDANDTFSEAFERTAAGTDYPANVDFFIPYGADLIDLRLRYQMGGMRTYARGVTASQNVATVGQQVVTAAQQVVTAAQQIVTKQQETANGTTAQETAADYQVFPSVTRGPTSAGVWFEVTCSAMYYGTQRIAFHIGNFTGGSRTFTYEVRTGTGGAGSYVGGGSVALNNQEQTTVVVNCDGSAIPLFARVQMTGTDGNWLFTATRYGYGSHVHAVPGQVVPAQNITIPSQQITVPSQNITVPSQQITIPGQTVNLDFGIRESATPATVRVYLDDVLITELNDRLTIRDFDLMPYVALDSNGRVREGWRRLTFRTATNGATGSVRGTLFQRKFLSTEAA